MFSTAAIVTTCNAPQTLRLVLLALSRQVIPPDEVIVADDGSGGETAELLAAMADDVSFRLLHVWQPDEGFRLARSRNNAVLATECDALAFLDQDVLPAREWLRGHLASLVPKAVSLASTMEVPLERVALVSAEAVRDGRYERMAAEEEENRLQQRQQHARRQLRLRRLRLVKSHKPRLFGNNFCVHRDVLESVNGFDERYEGWGQEDDDLARRLYAAGVRPVPAHDRARAFHLAHPVRREAIWGNGPNVARFHARKWRAVCPQGLNRRKRPDVRITDLSRPG